MAEAESAALQSGGGAFSFLNTRLMVPLAVLPVLVVLLAVTYYVRRKRMRDSESQFHAQLYTALTTNRNGPGVPRGTLVYVDPSKRIKTMKDAQLQKIQQRKYDEYLGGAPNPVTK